MQDKPFTLSPERQKFLDWQHDSIDRGLEDTRRAVAEDAAMRGVAGSPYQTGMYAPFLREGQDLKAGATAKVGMDELSRREFLDDLDSTRAFETTQLGRQIGFQRDDMRSREDMHRAEMDQRYKMFLEELDYNRQRDNALIRAKNQGAWLGMLGAVGGAFLPGWVSSVGDFISSPRRGSGPGVQETFPGEGLDLTSLTARPSYDFEGMSRSDAGSEMRGSRLPLDDFRR